MIESLNWFQCPRNKSGVQTRWDRCIALRLESMEHKKRSKCKNCPMVELLVKKLVMEVL
jgi:hypothetical protein